MLQRLLPLLLPLTTLIVHTISTPIPAPAPSPTVNIGSCTNALQNPSFESGIDPWLPMVSGSWESRGVYTSSGGGHSGSNFYYGHSNSTIDSSLVLSQSGFNVPGGATVECSAWLASRRPGNVGATSVEMFLDGTSCGVTNLGTTGWVKVGGKVQVQNGFHTLAIVILSYDAGPEGWSVWVDDVQVGVGC